METKRFDEFHFDESIENFDEAVFVKMVCFRLSGLASRQNRRPLVRVMIYYIFLGLSRRGPTSTS